MRYLRRGWLLAASLLVSAAADAQQPEWHVTPTIGGNGGRAYFLNCSNSFLAGVGIRQGALLDRIWLLCVPARASGEWEGPPQAPAGAAMGGDGGGGPYDLVCPPNFYVNGLNIVVDRGAASGGAVRTLTVYCLNPVDQQVAVLQAPSNAPYGDSGSGLSCPVGFLAVGVGGGAGQVVDRLGLQCQRASIRVPGPTIPRMGRRPRG